eukprot:CAMPEP_0195105536 /NCGR_PEP_ID=MMETSP0448-20130528/76752_1 /TAXON_ID=66468 /ORGANISM="Heterocapsa triquestra, Strain CCMP 448" /LENGTH=93 /DNA_ID=CAMNT_0040141579 /DNA_START=64 /DNA_END=341 /DNA_ORIENTATION=-
MRKTSGETTRETPAGTLRLSSVREPCGSLSAPCSEPRVAEGAGPRLDLLLQGRDLRVAREAKLEVLQLLAVGGLDLQGDLAAPVQEARDLLEV